MRKLSIWKLAALGAYCFCMPAFACDAMDSSFEPRGQIISRSGDGYLSNRSATYLPAILGAAYAKKDSDPKTQALYLSIDEQTKKLRIVHLLDTGTQGPEFEHDVVCTDGGWTYTETGKTSAEGAYREYAKSILLKVLSNGDLEVQYDDTTVHGLIFKTQSSVSVVAHFSKR